MAVNRNLIDGVDEETVLEHPNVRMHRRGVVEDEVKSLRLDTQMVRAAFHNETWTTDPLGRSVLNVPVYHNSTVTFKSVASLEYSMSDIPFNGMLYGIHGNPTSFALEEAFAIIEGGYSAVATSSGLAANNAALMAFVEAGDHVLMTDGAYYPTKLFSQRILKKFGVEVTYYQPNIGPEEFPELIQANTKAVYVETPTSNSFVLSDVAMIVQKAHEAGAVVICDNSWGGSIFKPHDLGCDVVTNAASKLVAGHSDLILGLISAKDEQTYRKVKEIVTDLGCPPGPDDCYNALRGMRTLGVRLKHQAESALRIAEWLESRTEVARVMHPALKSHPQNELFRRDFRGSSVLFGFQLRGFEHAAVVSMVENLKLFSLGFSWGGFKSLITITELPNWDYGAELGETLRLSIGLEDPLDLVEDLKEGFQILRTHSTVGS